MKHADIIKLDPHGENLIRFLGTSLNPILQGVWFCGVWQIICFVENMTLNFSDLPINARGSIVWKKFGKVGQASKKNPRYDLNFEYASFVVVIWRFDIYSILSLIFTTLRSDIKWISEIFKCPANKTGWNWGLNFWWSRKQNWRLVWWLALKMRNGLFTWGENWFWFSGESNLAWLCANIYLWWNLAVFNLECVAGKFKIGTVL